MHAHSMQVQIVWRRRSNISSPGISGGWLSIMEVYLIKDIMLQKIAFEAQSSVVWLGVWGNLRLT